MNTLVIPIFSTVGEAIHWASQSFDELGLYFGHGTDNAWDEAVYLVLGALGLPLDSDDSVLNKPIDDHQPLTTLLKRRIIDRVPVPYLLGEAWFANMSFLVNEKVLIPRSPIAELIDKHFSPWLNTDPKQILDLCTGSGCIGIACAMAFSESKVTLSDLSSEAIAISEKNIERHSLKSRVRAVESDLFKALNESYDLIVSNPPYVDQHDLDSMPEEYHHEPRLALEAGDDGLDLVKIILREAADYLEPEGLLIVEVGNSQIALQEAYPEVPFLWLEFENGGDGVFLLTKEQLIEHRASFL